MPGLPIEKDLAMCIHCTIIPRKVLERLAADKSLSDVQRKSLLTTLKLDVEMRKLRQQAHKISALGESAKSATATPPVIGVYDCNHTQSLPGSLIPNPASSTDPTVRQVFKVTGDVASFYRQIFARNSVDNAGMALNSSVHFGVNYNNAFWNGSQMTYGDGDGQIFVDFSKGNDVIGHELTHGVTQHSLQLGYTNESGGLNEAMSDIFGSMFRQWEANQDVNAADWLIGKDIMGPIALAKGFKCLRDMSNPSSKQALAPQPDHYAKYKPRMDPHESSGIPNFAFYKAAKAIGGKSWDTAGQIWYKALTGMGPKPSLKMKAFANQTRKLAQQLYSGNPNILSAVDTAWKQVGL
jgi:Zn-dependent metalloprotease